MSKTIDKILCFIPFNPQLNYKTNDYISGVIDASKIIGLIISTGSKDKSDVLLGAGLYGVSVIVDYYSQKIADRKYLEKEKMLP